MQRLDSLLALLMGVEILGVDTIDRITGEGLTLQIVNVPVDIDPAECVKHESFNRRHADELTREIHELLCRYATNNCVSTNTVAYAFATVLNIQAQTPDDKRRCEHGKP